MMMDGKIKDKEKKLVYSGIRFFGTHFYEYLI